jgi:predicted ATPase/DNA-binding XRE family transcriptional regulator
MARRYYTTFGLACGGAFRYNFRHTYDPKRHTLREGVMAVTAAHSFGALVRRQRKALDLTQAALAQRVGCAESLIRKIESEERRPSRQVAERLGDALQIAPEERELFVQVARGERSAAALTPHDQRLLWQPAQPEARLPLSLLPAPLTPLVGRAAELRALDALLADPAIRLLTIVAPGGMGKTRLAIAATARQQGATRFSHGVAFLDLTPIDRPERIAAMLAALFGLLPDTAGHTGRAAEAQVLNYLRAKRLLLVLDNAEHLLDAAPLLTSILHAAPGLALLITSRERLHLHGEQLFPLGGLTIPADPLLAEHSDATGLFLQVARRAAPTWTPAAGDLRSIATICRLTGGMPLAIELAGAWTTVLTPAAILAEIRRDLDMLSTTLRGVPERQRSVRAIFDATCRQMRQDLQAVFVRLAVFRAGFTYQAAAGVAGAALRDLADLVAAAVLSYDPASERYTLHELLRQYAAERLAQNAGAEAAALDAHAAFFCGYVTEHAPKLRSLEQRAAQAALEQEQENISVAWRRAITRRSLDLIDMATHALGLFYEQRADTVRGAAIFDEAAAALAEEPWLRAELRARLLTWRSAFLRPLGRLAEAERLARRALQLLDQAPEPSDTWRAAAAHAHIRLALAIDDLRGAEAMAEYQTALQHYRALGRIWEQSYVLYHIARLCCDLDQLEAAARYGQASLALREACGDARGGAHTLQLMSRTCLARGAFDEALTLAQRCRATFEQLSDRAGIAKGLRQIGGTLYWQGRFAEALPLAEQSLAIYQDFGLSVEMGTVQALISLLRSALGQAERAEEDARSAIALHLQHPRALAEDNVALGFALLAQGHDQEAEAALRASAALHEQLGRSAAPQAAALLGLCLMLRHTRQQAQKALAETLRNAGEQRAFMPLILGLAGAALLLEDMGDTVLAAEIAALAAGFPVIRNNHGLRARLQQQGDAGRALFGPELAAKADRGEPAQAIWETARQLAEVLNRG